jgi:hypothetical protein
VIELQVHGGPVCSRRVLTAAIEAGARPARPGEFTLRAFLNGRLDLSQAESVMQLVAARTAAAADSALAGLQGGVGEAVREIRCVRGARHHAFFLRGPHRLPRLLPRVFLSGPPLLGKRPPRARRGRGAPEGHAALSFEAQPPPNKPT